MDVAGTCGVADILVPKGALLPAFDLQSSLMSLP